MLRNVGPIDIPLQIVVRRVAGVSIATAAIVLGAAVIRLHLEWGGFENLEAAIAAT
jgi:hypothetical protein